MLMGRGKGDRVVVVEPLRAGSAGFGTVTTKVELSKRLPPDTVVKDQFLTPRGRELLLERMPELSGVSLPEDLRVYDVARYWTVDTFARLIHDVFSYMARDDESGRASAVWDGEGFVHADSREPVEPPPGEELLELWLTQKVAEELER